MLFIQTKSTLRVLLNQELKAKLHFTNYYYERNSKNSQSIDNDVTIQSVHTSIRLKNHPRCIVFDTKLQISEKFDSHMLILFLSS